MNRLRAQLTLDRWRAGRPLGPNRVAGQLIWFVFILLPIVGALANRGTEPGHALALVGAVVFSVAYVALVMVCFDARPQRTAYLLCLLLLALAATLTLADRVGWAYLFTYCAACIAIVTPSRWGLAAVLGVAALAAGCTLIAGGGDGAALGWAVSAIGIGLLLVLMRDLRVRNMELSEARAELARVAVMKERERFARDLHDLLGHSLSVIAIKSELAGRLLPGSPERAAAEVADVEHVARQALREVREAVSGYRRPTLDDELEGARMALSAAGIDADVEPCPVPLDPEVEAVLAWAVREGATNVIRHSGARHCSVRVRADEADASVEVLDDGPAPAVSAAILPGDGAGFGGDDGVGAGVGGGSTGNGLAGLAERAERLRGRIVAGRQPDGGFRLEVSVPVGSA